MISVIVPIYNEEKILAKNSLHFQALSHKAELIFVDGGSLDKSRQIAKKYGQVLMTKKGRACQLNYGAGYAQEDIVLFLHADTVIVQDTLMSIEDAVRNKSYIGGCLTQRIDKESFAYRLIESFGNIRARVTKVFYGDQGIFIRKDIFSKMSGFPEVPIMEDVIFTKNLRRQGETTVIPDRIIVSPRRWDKAGIVKTMFLYTLIDILFWLRFPLDKIKKLYDDSR